MLATLYKGVIDDRAASVPAAERGALQEARSRPLSGGAGRPVADRVVAEASVSAYRGAMAMAGGLMIVGGLISLAGIVRPAPRPEPRPAADHGAARLQQPCFEPERARSAPAAPAATPR